MKESELIREAKEALLLQGIPCWRNNSGVFMGKDANRSGGRFFMRAGLKGSSDILGCLPPGGWLLAAEAKGRYGKLRPEQEKFLAAIERAGGCALVFRSLEELMEGLHEYIAGKTTNKRGRAGSVGPSQ